MARIMIVDDDENCLKALARVLAREPAYEVESFSAAEPALARMRRTDFDLVISDYRMPEVDGIAFLKSIRERQPQVSRIIVSGYCDKEALFRAINIAQADRFIEKPYDGDELLAAVKELLGQRRHLGAKLAG